MRETVHFFLDRQADQFLHFFRSLAWVLGHHLYEYILDIGKSLDREAFERNDAEGGQQYRRADDQQALLQAESNDSMDHRALSPLCCSVSCSVRNSSAPPTTSRSPGFNPSRTTARSLKRRPRVTCRFW